MGCAEFGTRVEVERELQDVDDEETGFDPDEPEHFPNRESQPLPQYADVLPHHPFLLWICQKKSPVPPVDLL